MKKTLCLILFLILCTSCNKNEREITIYGEIHAEKQIYDREIDIIDEFYKKGGRTLFLEAGYCMGKMMNLWMESESDEIFEFLFELYEGTPFGNKEYFDYYKSIKEKFPELRFIGTDIEHGYGNKDKIKVFEDYFFENIYPALDDNEKMLADKSIAQGKECYTCPTPYETLSMREIMMGTNMIDAIQRTNEDIIGFYGNAHVFGNFQKKIMSEQVIEKFPWVKRIDLTRDYEAPIIETKEIEVAGLKYEVDFLSEESLGENVSYGSIKSLELYRLKNPASLKNYDKSGKLKSYFPFKINIGDVFLLRQNIEGGMSVDTFYIAEEGIADEKGYPALEELK